MTKPPTTKAPQTKGEKRLAGALELARKDNYILLTHIRSLERTVAELKTKIGRVQIPRAIEDEFSMECPQCAAVYYHLRDTVAGLHSYELAVFGTPSSHGMHQIGEHPRCQDCTILLGRGHLYRSRDGFCEGCMEFRERAAGRELEMSRA